MEVLSFCNASSQRNNQVKITYEGHLESMEHAIITQQYIDKILSNNTFLTLYFNGYFMVWSFSKKDLARTCVQRMLGISWCLYIGGNFKQMFGINQREIGKLSTIKINDKAYIFTSGK